MASGSFTGSGSKVRLKISWSSSKGTGGSTVSATLYAVNVDNYYFYATVNQGYSITINGSSKSGSTAKLSTSQNGTATLISHSKWVSYTGDKSITISGTANMSNINANGTIGTRSVSGTAKLDSVGSKPSLPTCNAPTTGTVSELGQTVTISWSKSTSYNNSGGYYVDVQVNGGSWTLYKNIGSLSTLSTTYTIPAGQGGTYRFRVTSYNDIGTAGDHSYSGTLTRNSLTAPTVGDIGTYNPYVSSTLTVSLSGGSQKNGSAFKRKASLYYGSTLLANCAEPANSNSSVTITYSAANFIAKLGTTKYSDTFKVVAWSENSNGSKSSTVEKNFLVDVNSDNGATPTIAAPTFSGGTLGNTGSCFISGISDLVVTSATAVLRRAPSGTTVTYKIECTGATARTGKTATFTNLSTGIKTVTITATDSRGLSTTATKQCRFQSWAKPSIKITSCTRSDATPTTATLVYTMTYSPIYAYSSGVNIQGAQLNNIQTQQYNINKGTWNDATSGMSITGLNTELSYNIYVQCSDKVSPTAYSQDNVTVPTIKSLFSIRKWGVGVGCVPQNGNALEVTGRSVLNGDVIISVHGKTTANDGKAGIVLSDTGTNAGVELVGETPYLDFHQGNSSSDYTHRIIGSSTGFNFYSNTGIHWYTGANGAKHAWIDSSGNMSVQGNIIATGTINGSNVRAEKIVPPTGELVVDGEVIADNLEDSGWVACTLANNFETYGSDPLEVRKIGNIVMLRGVITPKTNVTLNQTNIAALPVGYEPSGCNINWVQQGSGSNRWLARINEDGIIQGDRYSNNETANGTAVAGAWLNCFALWFLG